MQLRITNPILDGEPKQVFAGRPMNEEESMTSTILVTGGTGTLGRHVVRRLRDAGCGARVLSRYSRSPEDGVEFVIGDLATGDGIEAAVVGVGTVVHCAGSRKGDEDKALNLVRAASGAGVWHLVYISVVGADAFRSSAASTALCSATSDPSWPRSAPWPTPVCRGRRCEPPSSMTRS
jgi:nucleoside-diphosphate-sugar epimerase